MQDSPRYDSTRAAWEDIWDSASIETEFQAVRYPRSMATIQTYLPYLPKDALILEAGSGLSAVVMLLREMDYAVAGMDYALNALCASHDFDNRLPLLAGDVHKLPIAKDSLGGYLSFGVLEHFEHGMGPALAEAQRVLQPRGVLVLTIPYPHIVHRALALRRRLRGESGLNDETFYESTFTRNSLMQAVIQAGFIPCEVKPTSHSFTLWALGGPFRGQGYYQTSPLADTLGHVLSRVLPWAFNYSTLIIARKKEP
jgi:SAM-dependent methyltransferase